MTGIPKPLRTMNRETRTWLFVTMVAALAVFLIFLVSSSLSLFPGWWTLGSFVVVAFILETLNTQLRIQATGSTSFVIHLAASLLFGPLWSGFVAGLSTLGGQLVADRPP